jgi:hypothetical protein
VGEANKWPRDLIALEEFQRKRDKELDEDSRMKMGNEGK